MLLQIHASLSVLRFVIGDKMVLLGPAAVCLLPNRLNCHFTPVKAIPTQATRLALSELNLHLPRYSTQKLQKNFKFH